VKRAGRILCRPILGGLHREYVGFDFRQHTSYWRRSATVRSLGSIVVAPMTVVSGTSICEQHRGKPDWRSPSDANDLRPVLRVGRAFAAASPFLHLGHGRRSRSWGEQRAKPGRSRAPDPGAACRNPAPFQIADAGVPVIAPSGPIINADNPERASRWTATTSDHAQKRILTHRQHQAFCEACRRPTAKRQTEMMNDRVQPRRASRRWSQYPFGEAPREDLAPAPDGVTAEAASDY
jgi:hypothetical protein